MRIEEKEIIWKVINDYPQYEISNQGVIRKLESRKVIEQTYPKVELKHPLTGKIKNVPVHRLVAKAFIENPEGKPFVNHKDSNRLNYSIDNLEWVTPKENFNHAVNLGRATPELYNNLPVIGKNIFSGEIKKWSSGRKAGLELGVSCTSVSSVCLGKLTRVLDWKFVLEKDYNETSFIDMGYVPKYNTKSILQLDLEHVTVLAEYKSAREAERSTGVSFSKICLVCQGKRNTAGGFGWRYKDDALDLKFPDKEDRTKVAIMNLVPGINKKAVLQLNKQTGEVIAEYESAKTASEVTRVHRSAICTSCKNENRFAGGFKWKYKE